MKKHKKDTTINVQEPQTAYLTTRIIQRALSKATRNLTEEEMELMGYVVLVEGDWVVKKYKDGTVEQIEKLERITLSPDFELPS